MIDRMKHRLFGRLSACLVFVIVTLLMPMLALADEKKIYDARLEGYENNVTLDAGGTGLTWLLLVVLGALCIGVLFKSGKRTHLD
jgi:hypothetical protein